MNYNEVLDVAGMTGEILLKNGADTYRVEETVSIIGECYGLSIECFSIPTGIFVSVKYNDIDCCATVKRIKNRKVDLYKIELVNEFSRSLKQKQLTYEEAKEKLKEIDNAPNFNFPTRLIGASMTSYVYTLFFNGGIMDAIVATGISIFIYIILEKISEYEFAEFLQYFLSGLLIGVLSLIAENYIPGLDKNIVIIGSIMILVPGVLFTNGIKDALYGDFLSSIARISEAVMTVVAVSVGIGAMLALSIG